MLTVNGTCRAAARFYRYREAIASEQADCDRVTRTHALRPKRTQAQNRVPVHTFRTRLGGGGGKGGTSSRVGTYLVLPTQGTVQRNIGFGLPHLGFFHCRSTSVEQLPAVSERPAHTRRRRPEGGGAAGRRGARPATRPALREAPHTIPWIHIWPRG